MLLAQVSVWYQEARRGGNQFPSSLTLEDLRIVTSLRAGDWGPDILLCHYTHTINQRH